MADSPTVDQEIMAAILRQLEVLGLKQAWGKVEVFVEEGRVKAVVGSEREQLNRNILVTVS